MKKIFLSLFIIIIFLLPFLGVDAASISVKPKEVNIDAKFGKIAEEKILITNVGDEPALYKVYPDLYEKNAVISPADFQLEAGGSREVTVKVKMWRNGKYDFNLSIVARPLNVSGLTAAAGVKIPVKLSVTGLYFWGLAGLMLFIIFIIVYFLIKKFKKIKIIFIR